MRARLALTVFLALGVASCDGCRGGNQPPAAASASASNAAPAPPAPDAAKERRRLLSAEQRRVSTSIQPDDLTHRDLALRRLAARALSRIADEGAAKLLQPALSDEDPLVVAWAAYGLGYACKERGPHTVRALVARAAALAAEPPPGAAETEAAIFAIADALGRCGGAEAEATLRSWLTLSGSVAESAALGLGRLATRQKRLDDASVVALLDAASDPERPVAAALFPFTRLSNLGETVESRLLSVAKDALAKPGNRRVYAVRALGRAGSGAVEVLEKIVIGSETTSVERADAARELARHGEAGQAALTRALSALATPEQLEKAALLSATFGVLITTLDALEPPAKDARETLEWLADLSLPAESAVGHRRRVVRLRCEASALLAGSVDSAPKLTQCDPEKNGELGGLARTEVLGRAPITGARHKRWLELVASKHPRVRQAALGLLSAHPEVRDASKVLAEALRAEDGGTVATAAQLVAAYPDRAAKEPKRNADPDAGPPTLGAPHPDIVESLGVAFSKKFPPDAIETRSALMEAVGALQILTLKPAIEDACKSSNPTLRQHAEKALRLLGDRTRRCNVGTAGTDPPEFEKLATTPLRIVFATDAGEVALTLDPARAPVTVTRIAELARAGFYDGVVIHRVVPGFVVQLGDPAGDGYGGAGREPLRCETSPISFEPGSVGIALAGRDTGSSQLFVTLGPFPHLDGDYPLIGSAEPGWDRIAQGDVIRKARVDE